MPTTDSLAQDALPIGLAHNLVLTHDVPAGRAVRWSDVTYDANHPAIRVRREMEALFRAELDLGSAAQRVA